MNKEEISKILWDYKHQNKTNKEAVNELYELLKAEREATKEEIREWLISEDFEGLAERL